MKFLHTADIHLDSPLRGLERYEGAPVQEMRLASRRALENTVTLALEEAVDFVLIAGDIYDGDWKDYNTGLFFARLMSRLRDARIRVCLIKGNHDAASQISRELKMPDNVRVLSSRKCETVHWDDLGVAVHGQSLSTQAVTEDLTAHYPPATAGCFNIGLLHTSATGREGHETYAPCSVDGLLAKGYDYWALGHVHRREVLHEDPWILFPGNVQGRHARETGEKSCTLVSVEDGRIRRVEARAVDVARWAQCVVNVNEPDAYEDVLAAVRQGLEGEFERANGRILAARLIVQGSCRAHARLAAQSEPFVNDCRSLANDIGGGQIWVEKVRLKTRTPIAMEELIQRQDALGDLVRYLRSLAHDPDALGELLDPVKEIRQKLPLEIRSGPEALDLDDPRMLEPMLGEIEQLLIPRLLEQEAAR